MSAFKDQFFNRATLTELASDIERVHPKFPKKEFLKSVLANLDDRELKARVIHTSQCLREHLPPDYTRALKVLRSTKVTGFLVWPLTHFVSSFGLEHFEVSMQALQEMTQRFTAEFALRPFLLLSEEATVRTLTEWATHENEHVRRAASEGTRPYLPWGERIPSFKRDPSQGLAILELLKYDSSEYVRRSVANHLNDIAKDHPAKVTAVLERWIAEAPPEHRANVLRIARHASRTLLKKGDPRAMKIFGFSPRPAVAIKGLKLSRRRITMGDALGFSFTVTSTGSKAQKLMIDYAIHHKKANGKQTAKVFKLAVKTLNAGESLKIDSRHAFKKITTRRYHSGEHKIEILINGTSVGTAAFHLTADQ